MMKHKKTPTYNDAIDDVLKYFSKIRNNTLDSGEPSATILLVVALFAEVGDKISGMKK